MLTDVKYSKRRFTCQLHILVSIVDEAQGCFECVHFDPIIIYFHNLSTNFINSQGIKQIPNAQEKKAISNVLPGLGCPVSSDRNRSQKKISGWAETETHT